MQTLRIIVLLSLGCVILAGVYSCSESTETSSSFMGSVTIEAVDAAAGLNEFKMTINRIELHQTGLSASLGWRVVTQESQTFNLLALRNGIRLTLANSELPTGSYDRINIVFGSVTVRKSDNVERPVTLGPSASSGFAIDFGFSILDGQNYQLLFDFDAARSAKEVSLNQFVLNPVIRVQPTLQSGTISGAISPPSAAALVMTVVGGDTVSTYADTSSTNGSFELIGLPPSLYDLRIVPSAGGYAEARVSAVLVRAQRDTSVGVIVLH